MGGQAREVMMRGCMKNALSASYVPAVALVLAMIGGFIIAPRFESTAAPKPEARREGMTLRRPAFRTGSSGEAGLNGFRLAPMDAGIWTPIPTPEGAPEPLVVLNFPL